MVRRSWRELAVQDLVTLGYLVTLLGCVVAGHGARRNLALACSATDLALFVGALLLTRGGVLRGNAAAFVYRAGIFIAVFGSFSHLQYILPTARAVVVDADLYALDLRVLGFEPAEAFDAFVTPGMTEWFSFFYFGYFFIVAGHVLPVLLGTPPRRILAELSLGIVALFCFGHLLYILVPGHGPYQHLKDHFQNELHGPVWWRAVKSTVDSVEVSARTDIFPSLHTAAPTYLTLFAIRHRKMSPFKYTWLPLALATSQIILSTMYLRWHYAVDVVAGLLLASAIAFAAPRIVRWEYVRRSAHGLSPVWTIPYIPIGQLTTWWRARERRRAGT